MGAGVSLVLAILGAASIAAASIQAIGAEDVRRLALHACAAQAGAVVLSFALLSPMGTAAGLMHAASLSLVAFGLLGGVALLGGRATWDSLDGVGRRAPLAAAAIAASALRLVGAPLSLGFVSRWRLVEGTLQAGWWWAAGALVAASLAAVVYAGRLVERLYLRAPAAAAPPGWSLAPAHLAVTAATIGFGLDASGLWSVAWRAGEALLRTP
jgi:multicomponent Na+:H+ antiporter subunit D